MWMNVLKLTRQEQHMKVVCVIENHLFKRDRCEYVTIPIYILIKLRKYLEVLSIIPLKARFYRTLLFALCILHFFFSTTIWSLSTNPDNHSFPNFSLMTYGGRP